jgi:hypothetical protein
MTILLTQSGFNQMTVIIDLLGSLDLLQIGIHVFFLELYLISHHFFFVLVVVTNKKKKKKKIVEILQKFFW